jgi:hypothetical protein
VFAGGYLGAVGAFAAVRGPAGLPRPQALAATPAALASGKLWLLVTSAFVVSGPPAVELTAVAIAVATLVRRQGAGAFWRVAPITHFGSTLIAYAGVGVLWLADQGAVARIVHDPDFGISAVWMGVLGALLGGSVGSAMRASVRCREQDLREQLLVAVCLIAAVTGLVFFPPLPGAEHTLA